MALKLANNAVSKLAAAILSTDVSLTITPGDGAKFPVLAAGDWHPATLVKADGSLEIVRVTARVNDLLTVTRAQEGTVALAFASGDRIELRDTAAAKGELIQRDGSVQFTQHQKLKDSAPTDPLHATSKGYADGLVASGKNGFGARTVSVAAPGAGVGADGDIWYQV